MKIDSFAAAADFPGIWLACGLLQGDFFAQQAVEFEREYGGVKPSGGTEHWRYASFLALLRAQPTAARLVQLLDAALADPDPPMAGNVVKDVIANPLSTEQMLSRAAEAVAANPAYYVTREELIQLFNRSH
jgi:hypothetical protein